MSALLFSIILFAGGLIGFAGLYFFIYFFEKI